MVRPSRLDTNSFILTSICANRSDMARIERVVQIENPAVDIPETAVQMRAGLLATLHRYLQSSLFPELGIRT